MNVVFISPALRVKTSVSFGIYQNDTMYCDAVRKEIIKLINDFVKIY